ncbi:Proteasome subunit alpha type-2 [Hanseniaspora valbyensis]
MSDRYSFSLTTFSPSGKLGQIDYALQAVKNGVTAIAIKANNGIVLATEKKTPSPLVMNDTITKIENLTPDIGVVYAGMGPDFRVIVDKARKMVLTNYKAKFGEYPPVKILVSQVASIMQEATQSGGVRPFGLSLLIGGYDEHNHYQLYQVDPSGSYYPWKATSIGKGSIAAKTFLEKRWNDELELEDAIHIVLLTLKESFEGDFKGENIEISIINEENLDLLGFKGDKKAKGPRFRNLSSQEINDRLDAL